MNNYILGVRIDEVTREKATEMVSEFLDSNRLNIVFTPNPEMLVKAQSDNVFLKVLNQSSLNLCDGFGLYLAAKMKGLKVERITGVDFLLEILNAAADKKLKVYLLGSGSDEVLEKAIIKLKNTISYIDICGYNRGLTITEENGLIKYDPVGNDAILEDVKISGAEVLVVAFGMGKQEKWIVENVPVLNSVKLAIGVGGSLDFLSGKIPRAPLLMRKFGLEWAYRLWNEPKRLKRIYNATIKFSLLFFLKKQL